MTPRAPIQSRQSGPFRSFGRRASVSSEAGAVDAGAAATQVADEFRLFALTFVGGFLFMTIYLA